MKTLKVKAVYLADYGTFEDLTANLFRSTNKLYYDKQMHSTLGYLSPTQVEKQHA